MDFDISEIIFQGKNLTILTSRFYLFDQYFILIDYIDYVDISTSTLDEMLRIQHIRGGKKICLPVKIS